MFIRKCVKIYWYPEAGAQRCSVKMVFLEISQSSQENTCARVSFLIKLQVMLQFRDVLVEKKVTLSWLVNSDMVKPDNFGHLHLVHQFTVPLKNSFLIKHLLNDCLYTNAVYSQKNISNWILFFTFNLKKTFGSSIFFLDFPSCLVLKKIPVLLQFNF